MIPDICAYTYCSIFILYQLVLWIWLKKTQANSTKTLQEEPQVSILVAARNEEDTIGSCLQALTQVDYPSHLLTIYIGNDQSTDGTSSIVEQWQQRNPSIRLIQITENIGTARGKANVLAQLAKATTAPYLFITDADIQVPTTWVRSMLAAFKEGDGIVSGSTIVEGNGFLAQVQKMDWSYAFGMVYVVSEKGFPVSAVGNNMCIRRTAYEATGGYEALSFSITEDLELFLATLKKGFGYRQLMQADVVAISRPQASWRNLLHQRKRWLTGALRVPPILLFFLVLQALFFPMLLALLYWKPGVAVVFYSTKTLLQYGFLYDVYRRIQRRFKLRDIVYFEGYSYLFPLVLIGYQLWPGKIEWKGRTYTKKEAQPI
ncbi:MAG: glycosyltransferase [Cytophagaceae bacterium]|nr:glycosyltransferase [Cytophagaceae bacterium]